MGVVNNAGKNWCITDKPTKPSGALNLIYRRQVQTVLFNCSKRLLRVLPLF
jgi:hypothetical protein